MMLHHKNRLATWGDVVGQVKAIKQVRRIVCRPDFDGDCFWIAGMLGVVETGLGWFIIRHTGIRRHPGLTTEGAKL